MVESFAGALRRAPVLLSIAVVLVSACVSLAVGPAPIRLDAVFAVLAGHGDPVSSNIVLQIRAPRTLLAVLIGAILGLAGAALQGLLRNPLADPALIGTSNAAALGAVIALYFGLAKAFPLALPLMAMAGALIGLLAILPMVRRGEGPSTLILAGVAVSAISGAGVSLALNLAPNPFAVSEIAFWLMGSLSDRSFQHVWIAAPFILVGGGLMLWQGRALDALALGEDGARSLGFNLDRVRVLIVTGLALGVGAAVAVAGAVGFVGLIAPHMVRPFTDGRPSQTLAPSALAGAALLGVADLAVRLVPTSTELRLGVVTAFLGAPVFIAILMRSARAGWGRP